jgi:Gpi18-like mannosyltransferase
LLIGIVVVWLPPFLRVVPRDYLDFLLPWYDHIRTEGVIGAFAHPFSNYTPTYLYFLAASTLLHLPPLITIKLLSALASAWAAFAAYRLLLAVAAPHPLEGALAILLLPTVTFNAPILAQADMFWVAPCLLAIASACRHRTASMALWAGVAFAFKAQAIFLAPFVVAMMFAVGAPWWQFLIPIIVYMCAMLPAWLAGWPAVDLLTVYVRQAQYVPPNGVPFVSTASNWWALFAYFDYDRALKSFWIGFIVAAGATLLYLRQFAARPTPQLLVAALSAIILPFLLPGMHERFYALAELATFSLAWASRSLRTSIAAFLMQAQLVLAYFGWILRTPELTIVGAGLTALAFWLLLSEWLVLQVQPEIGENRRPEALLRNHRDGTVSDEKPFTIL